MSKINSKRKAINSSLLTRLDVFVTWGNVEGERLIMISLLSISFIYYDK